MIPIGWGKNQLTVCITEGGAVGALRFCWRKGTQNFWLGEPNWPCSRWKSWGCIAALVGVGCSAISLLLGESPPFIVGLYIFKLPSSASWQPLRMLLGGPEQLGKWMVWSGSASICVAKFLSPTLHVQHEVSDKLHISTKRHHISTNSHRKK